MNDEQIGTLKQIQSFLEGAEPAHFEGAIREEKYTWIAQTLQRFKYFILRKKDKSIVKTFVRRMTGFSDAQMTRLIDQKKKVSVIVVQARKRRHRFHSCPIKTPTT
jgi:hypothetical protein